MKAGTRARPGVAHHRAGRTRRLFFVQPNFPYTAVFFRGWRTKLPPPGESVLALGLFRPKRARSSQSRIGVRAVCQEPVKKLLLLRSECPAAGVSAVLPPHPFSTNQKPLSHRDTPSNRSKPSPDDAMFAARSNRIFTAPKRGVPPKRYKLLTRA